MSEIIKAENTASKLPTLPARMLPALAELTDYLGVAREVLASDEEIEYAWHDLPRELRQIPPHLRDELIARMCVAVSAGLFDSAVNYIWNAAILHLRDKTRNFGLTIVAQILQKDFEEKHLLELQDSQLLELCLKLSLITEDGYFFLDQCRDIRNNFSAAHPTLGKINDREFVLFLNRCTKYALAESASPKGVDISAFMSAVKGARFSDGQLQIWVDRLASTYDAQRQLLIGTIHGFYCDPNTPETARLNSLDLCNHLQKGFTSQIKSDLINKHSNYLAKGDERRYAVSSEFFEKLGLIDLLNESERHTIFSRAIEWLWNTHLNMNNFYNEPPYAERLLELSSNTKVPETAQDQFVQTVVSCYIGDGYGVSWAAESKYEKMIQDFSPREVFIMIRSFSGDGHIGKRVKRSSKCKSRFIQALKLIDPASVESGVKADYETLLKGAKAIS